MSKTIHVAAHELTGGITPKKGDSKQSVTVEPGAHLTDEVKRQLGLTTIMVDDLIKKGAITVVPVQGFEMVGDAELEAEIAALRAQLAVANQRADDAEAKLLDAPAKPAA